MNPENTKKLFDGFPLLYRGRHLGPEHGAMRWGFCCGDGWFDIIYRLSADLARYAQDHGLENELMVLAVKEKSGRLRFHTTLMFGDPPEIREMLEAAWKEAEYVCEECGVTGASLVNANGIQELCPRCMQDRAS